jgi:hypothetical protein
MTNLLLSERVLMTASVKVSHHFPVCDMGSPARTVSVVFMRRTPCFAQRVRSPFFGVGIPRFSCISLNMFLSEGGFLTQSMTEKERP